MLLAEAPDDWEHIILQYSQVGAHIECQIGFTAVSGATRGWDTSPEPWYCFQELRGGMYTEGQGTWFTARYDVVRPGRYTINYEWEAAPAFHTAPPPAAFVAEQERFPRAGNFSPGWFQAGLVRARGQVS